MFHISTVNIQSMYLRLNGDTYPRSKPRLIHPSNKRRLSKPGDSSLLVALFPRTLSRDGWLSANHHTTKMRPYVKHPQGFFQPAGEPKPCTPTRCATSPIVAPPLAHMNLDMPLN